MRTFVFLGIVGAVLLQTAPVARADVIAPNLPVAGVSQAQLSAQWWQWAVSFPSDVNPLGDSTGASSYLGNQGAVFFLAGSFSSSPITRTVSVSENQLLFFPLINGISGHPFIPAYGDGEANWRQDVSDALGTVSNLWLTLNGTPVPLPGSAPDLLDYRQKSPPACLT